MFVKYIYILTLNGKYNSLLCISDYTLNFLSFSFTNVYVAACFELLNVNGTRSSEKISLIQKRAIFF